MTARPTPIKSPNRALSTSWVTNSLPSRWPASSIALVVRSMSPLPASLMNRSRRSSRWNRKKITNSNTIPVVVNGVTKG